MVEHTNPIYIYIYIYKNSLYVIIPMSLPTLSAQKSLTYISFLQTLDLPWVICNKDG